MTEDRLHQPNAEEEAPGGELHITDRRNRILQMVNQQGRVRVTDLSRLFNISEVTIRSDLGELERLNQLERVHGGAIRSVKSYYRMNVQERMTTNAGEKAAIAERVRGMIGEGDTIFLNSGTTTFYIARAIKDCLNILVITNSPLAAQELGYSDRCEVVLVGGSYNAALSFTYGDDAVKQISKYRANKYFFACDGVSAASGVTTYNTHEVDINRRFMENSATVVAVADSTKIGRVSRVLVEAVGCLDAVVTGSAADEGELEAIAAAGVEIVRV